MNTDDLVSALAADGGRTGPSPDRTLVLAVLASIAVAGAMLIGTMGLRPDFVESLGTLRFPFKFVVTVGLAATAVAVFRHTLFPVSSGRPNWPLLLIAPAVLLAGVAAELFTLPADAWMMTAQGKNALLCLTVVPLLGLVPLGLMIWTLRQGAPTRPALGGFVAGILAGSIAATFYAANCTDDSPLFVATWYPISIGLLGGLGALLGSRFARW